MGLAATTANKLFYFAVKIQKEAELLKISNQLLEISSLKQNENGNGGVVNDNLIEMEKRLTAMQKAAETAIKFIETMIEFHDKIIDKTIQLAKPNLG